MKKLLTIIFLLLNLSIFSQVNFPNAKQYLKEFIAIQSLLAENRMEDLKIFCINYNYLATPKNDEIVLYQLDLDGLINENDIQVGIFVKSGSGGVYADNYIQIIFFRNPNGKLDKTFSLDECKSIENIIQNTYQTGTPYTMLPSADSNIKTEGMNIEKIDRYNYILSSVKNPDKKTYLEASNFMRLEAIDKNKVNNIGFLGPGKAILTEIFYFEPIKSDIEGRYFYKMELGSWISNEFEPKEKFNVDFFMSLKNFNDRIWLDK